MRTEREQFNVRIRKEIRKAAVAICDQLDYTRDELAEVALATLFGTVDEELQARQRKIQKAAQQMSLSFNQPDLPLDGFEIAA